MDYSQYGGASAELTTLLSTLAPPPDLTVDQLKQVTNRGREDVSATEMILLSSKIEVTDHEIQVRDGHALEARSYRSVNADETKPLPIYIHFHGGGYLFGTLSSEDSTCSRIALDTDTVVVNVNYRHSPDWKYPTAWHDSEDAYEWVFSNAHEFGGDPTRIVIGGISAGAQLTAALALTKKREGAKSFEALKGQVLMIPCTSHPDCYEPLRAQMASPDVSSYIENEFAPILPVERMNLFTSLLYNSIPDVSDRRANPGHASPAEVEGLPPATFGIAGLDPLRDEGLLYARLLGENGVRTDVHVFKGVPHGYRRYGEKLKLSKDWDEVMHKGILWALHGAAELGRNGEAVVVHE